MEFETGSLSIELNATVADALELITESGLRVVFVTEGGVLRGAVSDGDLRRALLRGADLRDGVTSVMNRSVLTTHQGEDLALVHAKFRRGVEILPVVSDTGVLMRLIDDPGDLFVPVAAPDLGSREESLVRECMISGWVSSTGPFVREFEEAFAGYVGAANAVTVANGTLGLVLALKALGVGLGDEVVVPDLTFGATANAVCQVGAIPVFCDVDDATWGMSAATLEPCITARTRAVIPVHLYGHPVDLEPIVSLCSRRNISVIEDCAEAIGARIGSRHVGIVGDAGVFSFFANKTVTTGEGGMVVFADPERESEARRMRSHGFSRHKRYWHDSWGTNFRMSNLQAALGVGQLERIEHLVQKKRQNALRYNGLLSQLEELGLELPPEADWATNSYWLYTVLLPSEVDRTEIALGLEVLGIETRPTFFPLSAQPAFVEYREQARTYAVSSRISERGLSLPSGTTLTESDIERVARSFSRVLRERLP